MIPAAYREPLGGRRARPSELAARSAAIIIAAPLGTAVGGPLVATLCAARTLTVSGAVTLLLAAVATATWRRGMCNERA